MSLGTLKERRQTSIRDFEWLSREADAAGFRIEVVRGLAIIEPTPGRRHQEAVDRIQTSIVAGNSRGCAQATGVHLRFPDGSRTRPDIAIFRHELNDRETEVTRLPEAVIEVLSADFEAKDLVVCLPFYRLIGIPDVVVFDPETNVVRHWQSGRGEQAYTSPKTLTLLCGCTCTV